MHLKELEEAAWKPAPDKGISYRVKVYLALAFVASLIVAGLIVLHADSKSGGASAPKDSGLVACQQIAHNAAANNNEDTSKPMTKAELAAKSKPFLESNFADVRSAGVGMIKTVYDLDQQSTADADLGTSIEMLTKVESKYTALQNACAAHGVDIPDLRS